MLRETRTRMGGLIRINTVVLLREPGPLVSRLVMPVILMVILRPLYTAALPHGGTAQAVTGMSVMFSLLALGLVGSGILNERIWHTWDRLRSSATTPVEILVAKSVPSLGFLAAQQLVVFTVGALTLGLPVTHPGLLLLATGTWVVMLLGLGMALGTLSRSHAELAAAQEVGGLVLTSLGGALVPLAVLPGWVHHMAPLTPGYWGVQAMTAALSGDASGSWRQEESSPGSR
jgi:ABC-2 type transport system permease protein